MEFMISQLFKKVWFLWALSLIFNIITLLLVYFKVGSSGKILALHYNVVTGVDWYGSSKYLYQIPAGAFFITALNFIFYRFVKNTGMFYAPLAAGINVVVVATLLFAAILIIRAN
jgi:hypothetical protein